LRHGRITTLSLADTVKILKGGKRHLEKPWEEFDGFLGAIRGRPRIWVYSARRRMLSEWLLNSGAYMHSIEAYPMGYSPANCTLTGYSKT